MRRIFSFSLLLLWAMWADYYHWLASFMLLRFFFFSSLLFIFFFCIHFIFLSFAHLPMPPSYTIWNTHFHRVRRSLCGIFFFRFFLCAPISLVKAKLESGTWEKREKHGAHQKWRRKKKNAKSKRNINCVLTDVPACHSDLMPCSHAISTDFKCFFITLLFYYTFQLAEKMLKSDFFVFTTIALCLHSN